MTYLRRLSLVVVIFILTAAFVSANGITQVSSEAGQAYYVSADGDDANNGLSEQQALKTLNKAVTIASMGGIKRIVIIGTLDSKSEANNKDNDSVFSIKNSGDNEITIIGKDEVTPGKLLGENGKRVISITGKSRVRFENILITGGNTEKYGGGIYAAHSAEIVLAKNAVISGNCATDGGGIFIEIGSLTMLQNAAVRDNYVIYEGDTGGGVVLLGSDFKMTDNAEISGNTGGGIILTETIFNMSGESRISMNKASHYGGGIFAMLSSDITIYENAVIDQNETEKRGGGISLDESSLIVRGRAVISGNTGTLDGGGIYAKESYVILDENAVLEGNNSECGGGFCIEHFSSAIVRGNVKVMDNKSWGPQGGGGLCAGLYSNIHMTGGLVTGNSSSNGGGVYIEGAVFTFSYGNITDNSAKTGGGIYSGPGGFLYIEDDSSVNDNYPDDIFEYDDIFDY